MAAWRLKRAQPDAKELPSWLKERVCESRESFLHASFFPPLPAFFDPLCSAAEYYHTWVVYCSQDSRKYAAASCRVYYLPSVWLFWYILQGGGCGTLKSLCFYAYMHVSILYYQLTTLCFYLGFCYLCLPRRPSNQGESIATYVLARSREIQRMTHWRINA